MSNAICRAGFSTAHYLTWVDMAHTEAIDQLTGGYRAMAAGGIDVVVAAAELQFRSPARFDDRLVVRTVIHPPGNTSLRSDFTITRGDELLAECTMTHVCVDATDYRKQPWPDWLRAKLPAKTVERSARATRLIAVTASPKKIR